MRPHHAGQRHVRGHPSQSPLMLFCQPQVRSRRPLPSCRIASVLNQTDDPPYVMAGPDPWPSGLNRQPLFFFAPNGRRWRKAPDEGLETGRYRNCVKPFALIRASSPVPGEVMSYPPSASNAKKSKAQTGCPMKGKSKPDSRGPDPAIQGNILKHLNLLPWTDGHDVGRGNKVFGGEHERGRGGRSALTEIRRAFLQEGADGLAEFA